MVLVWIAVGAVLGLLVGVGAGVLAWLGGQAVPLAVLQGCTTFGGTLALVIMIHNFLHDPPDPPSTAVSRPTATANRPGEPRGAQVTGGDRDAEVGDAGTPRGAGH
jgi:hypothetical protein